MRADYIRFVEGMLKHRAEGLMSTPEHVPLLGTEEDARDALNVTYSAYRKLREYKMYAARPSEHDGIMMSVNNSYQLDELEWLIDLIEVEIHRIHDIATVSWFAREAALRDIKEYRDWQRYTVGMWQALMN